MMSTNHDQLMRLLYFAGCGLLLGAYYEIRRVWQRLSKPSKAKRFAADILYCLTAGFAVFLVSLAVQNGIWDVWMFLGLAAGVTTWRQTGGRLTAPLCRFLHALHRFIYRLYRKTDEIGRKTLKKVWIFFKKGLHSFRRWVYNQK